MNVIVPLAGPDFIINEKQTKAELQVLGKPLLLTTLLSRPWAVDVEEYIFVLQDRPEARAFVDRSLSEWFPSAKLCFVSHRTQGAAFSVLGACALINSVSSPVIIDLADIYFESQLSGPNLTQMLEKADAAGIIFKSSAECYSYIAFNQNGDFEEAREKMVISRNASAGVYIYKNIGTYIEALSETLHNRDYMFKGLWYVCPVFNGVRNLGGKVLTVDVSNIVDIKETSV